MKTQEIARFECAGDVRMVGAAEQEDGSLEIREDVIGPSALIAYGDQVHGLRMTLSGGERGKLSRLLAETGRSSFEEYLSNEELTLVDLMDLCDCLGVPYSFTSLGSEGEAVYRPA